MDDSLSLNVQNSQLYITIINGNHNRTINGSELALPHPQSSTDLGRGVPSKRSPSMTSANVERGEEGADASCDVLDALGEPIIPSTSSNVERHEEGHDHTTSEGLPQTQPHTDTAGSEQDSTRSSKERSRSRRKLKGGLLATLFMLSLKKMVSLPLSPSPSPSPSPPPPAPATPPPPNRTVRTPTATGVSPSNSPVPRPWAALSAPPPSPLLLPERIPITPDWLDLG